ncbi:MAG: hypothetical protein UFP03_04890 [Paludibacteraceae bacterium]|nr:hypothetical protein [Paludibacteraceae bacterium]
MKKMSLFAAVAAMLMSFASCEKVEPTALETSDLKGTTLAGYVYYPKLDDAMAPEGNTLFAGKANVTIEVTELGADDKATGNVMVVTAALKGGKFEANIPVAAGKKAKCKATCMFQQENYDAEVKPSDSDIKKVMLTYKGEANQTLTYGETVYVDLIGKRVGATNDPYHFNP